MEIKVLPIDEVKPYKNNPRDNDDAVDAVANSIKKFGWQQPIVIDRNNVIVAGDTRYKAAKKLRYKQVPCTPAKHKDGTWLTDEECNAYRLADNKSGELAVWNDDLLDEEMGKIKDIDMTQFGFEDITNPDLPDNFFDDDSSNQSTEPEKIMLDWGTNSTEITKQDQALLDKKFNKYDSKKEGGKSFVQFLFEE